MQIAYPRLPVPFMNDDHDHAADQIATMRMMLATNPDGREPLVRACQAFLDHNRAHFAREETAMLQSGFPALTVHRAEHERVLAWLEAFLANVQAGQDYAAAVAMVERDIPAWFVQHIETMDRVTATWIASHIPASSVSV